MSADVFRDLTELHTKMTFPRDGSLMTPEFLDFRFKFLLEELIEMDASIEAQDAPGIVDSLIDLKVVAAGTIDLAAVDGDKAWNEVQRANMGKECRANPTRSGSGGFDLVKPDGWEPPDHSDNVGTLPQALKGRRTMPRAVSVLLDVIKTHILDKTTDYDSGGIRKADYFIHGLDDLEYEVNKKHLRFRSVLSNWKSGKDPKFESLIDTIKDQIAYLSYVVEWLEGRMDGQQKPGRYDVCTDPQCPYILPEGHRIKDHE